VLDAPFAPGLGLVATWELLELHAPDGYARHDYYQAVGATVGPDALWDTVPCADYLSPGGGGGLCVAAGSQGGGDGLFRIEADWSINLVDPINNITQVSYDATGRFDATGVPTLYWAGPVGLQPHNGAVLQPGNHNGGFTEVLPDGQILSATNDAGPWDLGLIASGTHAITVLAQTPGLRPVNNQNAGAFAIVSGSIAALPGYAYVVVETSRLVELAQDGTMTVLAETDPQDDWVWSHAVVPPAGHPLAAGGPAFYVLEYNPRTEQNRILRIAPP
jgi:hypothetical protein